MKLSRTKKIVIGACVVLFAAAQAVGLFFLIRTRPATSLTLSETELVLKMDEGRRITHTIEPAAARGKVLAYNVSWSENTIAWIDRQNEMIVAVSPGDCTIRASVDGAEAKIGVTVTEETVMAGNWLAKDGTTLSLDQSLAGRLNGTPVQWIRIAFYEGENSNPDRYVKLTYVRDGVLHTLYYDRLEDTMRLRVDGAADRILTRN